MTTDEDRGTWWLSSLSSACEVSSSCWQLPEVLALIEGAMRQRMTNTRADVGENHPPSPVTLSNTPRSKSLPFPILFPSITSRFRSNTDICVPSNVTRDSSRAAPHR